MIYTSRQLLFHLKHNQIIVCTIRWRHMIHTSRQLLFLLKHWTRLPCEQFDEDTWFMQVDSNYSVCNKNQMIVWTIRWGHMIHTSRQLLFRLKHWTRLPCEQFDENTWFIQVDSYYSVWNTESDYRVNNSVRTHDSYKSTVIIPFETLNQIIAWTFRLEHMIHTSRQLLFRLKHWTRLSCEHFGENSAPANALLTSSIYCRKNFVAKF
jgi:hypothetical protein